VTLDAPVADIATMLEARRVKRAPAVEAGRLAGMVSRSNLVQALAATAGDAKGARPMDDTTIRAQLLRELGHPPWWRREQSFVDVEDGVVTYFGTIDSPEEREAARGRRKRAGRAPGRRPTLGVPRAAVDGLR
jgi:CBS domain-containing protein